MSVPGTSFIILFYSPTMRPTRTFLIACFIFFEGSRFYDPDAFPSDKSILITVSFANADKPGRPWSHTRPGILFLRHAFLLFSRICSVCVRSMLQTLRCISRPPVNHPFSVWPSTIGQPFLGSGSIHPRTAAHTCIVPDGHPSHHLFHVLTEEDAQCQIPDLYRICINVQPLRTVWRCQAATTVLQRVIHNYFS